MPFLQSLRDLDLNMRKFKINDHLGNYVSGLRHLSAVNDVHFDAVVWYTQLHALDSLALELYSLDTEKTKGRIRRAITSSVNLTHSHPMVFF
jgi:elongator complex protein 1